MRLRLTAGQSVFLHGLMAPKRTLSWEDVLANDAFTLPRLLAANLSLVALHQLQPDPAAWVRAKRVSLPDCPLMAPWGAHPTRDFGADLGDIADAKWSVDTMLAMGLTYADLEDVGLCLSNLRLFTHVSFLGWAQLGLSRAHVADAPEHALVRLFGLSKFDVIRSLKPDPPSTAPAARS
jgi:hypothetical protein